MYYPKRNYIRVSRYEEDQVPRKKPEAVVADLGQSRRGPGHPRSLRAAVRERPIAVPFPRGSRYIVTIMTIIIVESLLLIIWVLLS